MAIKYQTVEIKESDGPLLSFLYGTTVGRFILKPLVQPVFSRIGGVLLNSSLSKVFIASFIKKNAIDLADYQPQTYRSFNDFFKREIIEEARPFPTDERFIPSPCDGKVTVYPISEGLRFNVKNASYNVAELVKRDDLARDYLGGTLVILRLTPDDYHHYCFLDDGQITDYWRIEGLLHTVRPVSASQAKVYVNNSREVTVMETKRLGKVTQLEVGALLVGKIVNQQVTGTVTCAKKKGYFEFGGSTIILLFQKEQFDVAPELLLNTQRHQETIIKMGQIIGKMKEKNHA